MLHKLTLGHLEVAAVRERRAVAVKPLDMRVVTQLLDELGRVDKQGWPTLGGGRVEIGDGYVVVPWLMPSPVPEALEFARRLHESTGCLMADLGRRELVTMERFEREALGTCDSADGASGIPDQGSDISEAALTGKSRGRRLA